MNENPFVRGLCILLALIMVGGDPTWAAGVSDFFHSSFSSDLRDLSVPTKLGMITERHLASSESRVLSPESRKTPDSNSALSTQDTALVVLIQDLHANVGVQKNIAGIIAHLF